MNALEKTAIDILLDWLGDPSEPVTASSDAPPILLTRANDRPLAVSIHSLIEPESDPLWPRRCDAVASQLEARGCPALSLWVPPGADLPHGDRTDFLERVAQAAAGLEPGARGQVDFPVSLTLKKVTSEQSYVQVVGGLAPHWARLTGKAYGQYLLDSSSIHRLPESEERITDLLEWVALLGNGMKPGKSSEVKAEDVWTVRRQRVAQQTAVIGAPPDTDPANGTSVRRLLRRGLKQAAELPVPEDAQRVVLFVGVFQNVAEENATIALRGCDPALYAQFDLVGLVSDGRCKSLSGRGINSAAR